MNSFKLIILLCVYRCYSKSIYGEIYSNLFCLIHEKDSVGPGIEVEADEAVDVVKKMILDDGGVGEAHCERVHSLVESTFHQQKRVFSEQVRYRTGITAIQQLPFVLQNEPVHLRVRREHRRLAEHVRREDRTVPLHALVDERLRIVALVRRYQLQRLAAVSSASRRGATACR